MSKERTKLWKQAYYYTSHFFRFQNDQYFGETIIFECVPTFLHFLKEQMIVCKVIYFEGNNQR